MAKSKAGNSSSTKKMRPALTPEADENQMISLAVDLARQQLIDGTASSQIIAHYLKLGSTKNQLELEKLRSENELLKAKKETLESAKRIEELYEEAMNAMKGYSGQYVPEDDEYE